MFLAIGPDRFWVLGSGARSTVQVRAASFHLSPVKVSDAGNFPGSPSSSLSDLNFSNAYGFFRVRLGNPNLRWRRSFSVAFLVSEATHGTPSTDARIVHQQTQFSGDTGNAHGTAPVNRNA